MSLSEFRAKMIQIYFQLDYVWFRKWAQFMIVFYSYTLTDKFFEDINSVHKGYR